LLHAATLHTVAVTSSTSINFIKAFFNKQYNISKFDYKLKTIEAENPERVKQPPQLKIYWSLKKCK